MDSASVDSWDELWSRISSIKSRINRYKAINVNSNQLREHTKQAVQFYFRKTRPDLVTVGIREEELLRIDKGIQVLLKLSHGKNSKRIYSSTLRTLFSQRSSLSLLREQRLSEQLSTLTTKKSARLTPIEERIIDTLKEMVPSAALSYEQACNDLKSTTRLSSRGIAVELRETLREILDELAPDGVVEKMPGFKLEVNQNKPTMKQKARFVLRSRGKGKTAIKTPIDSASLVEEITSTLVRSTYERGSISTHIQTARAEVLQLKMYVDSVLAELLEIHSK